MPALGKKHLRYGDLANPVTHCRFIIRISTHVAQKHLSKDLANLAEGETLLICEHNVPIAELRLLAAKRTNPRPIGLAKGTFEIPASFFAPLPGDLTSLCDE